MIKTKIQKELQIIKNLNRFRNFAKQIKIPNKNNLYDRRIIKITGNGFSPLRTKQTNHYSKHGKNIGEILDSLSRSQKNNKTIVNENNPYFEKSV